VTPDPGGGLVAVSVKRRDLEQPLQAADLSDGQLAWLAFVAMTRLNAGRSLLAIDEPESHLHPSLLGRVVELLKCVDGGAPVLVSTHSDRVLELVDEPARSIRVCQLDEKGSSSVTGLEEEHLALWLKEFGDVAQLRASGYLPRVLKAAAKSDRGKEAS
jgi:predicted ATPase